MAKNALLLGGAAVAALALLRRGEQDRPAPSLQPKPPEKPRPYYNPAPSRPQSPPDRTWLLAPAPIRASVAG